MERTGGTDRHSSVIERFQERTDKTEEDKDGPVPGLKSAGPFEVETGDGLNTVARLKPQPGELPGEL